ncbi:MAG: primosomal protein N' [Oscillibacter sp.]|nr:primosomal protein N' [Oscillibacter sp.]
METAVIVKVAVGAAPYSIDKPYDYLVPDLWLEAALPGARVSVPFGRGNRTTDGIILAREKGERRKGLKPLSSVLDPEPVLDQEDIALALWMRQRYFCTLYEAVKAILPAGLWYSLRESWRLQDPNLDRLTADGMAASVRRALPVLDTLYGAGGSADLETLRAACGEGVETTLWALEKAGVVVCETAAKRRISDKTHRMVELAVSAEEALALTEPKRRSASQRYEAVRLLASAGRTSAADLHYFTGVSLQALRGLEKAGVVTFTEEEVLRVPVLEAVEQEGPGTLNPEQQAAFDQMVELTRTGKPEAVLLHGVTGSGKTQIYLHLVREVLSRGKTAMVLVPEIVLTPQMMRKFSACFGSQVAMLHSSLRMTERYDQWKRIRRGEVQVVLGTRSAIFAPLRHLGAVILDEEQESSYQSENPPRYHTREIAKYLCARERALLVLGSATPAVETAWAAEEGIYHKVLLRRRYNEGNLPQVTIADLREELRAGNAGLIGRELRQELARNLERGEQSILFLNRRGSSRYVLCGECGAVPECRRCSVPLTYHSANGRLMCHYCGYSEPAPERCPGCGGIMKQIGAGTQKVEEELHRLFPGTEILRMDADTASGGHEPILRKFELENIPILLGTQMVAKGLDFERVTLVGVLSADLSLYVDHFRAAERTFSLLTQVVGRAGRGDRAGRAVIQTFTPGNEVIQCAARQDYGGFYQNEIRLRRLRRYPPFADLFTFAVSGTEEGQVLRASLWVRETLLQILPELAESQPEVLGPAPAPVLKVNNRYRYRVLLVSRNDKAARERVSWLLRAFAGERAHRGTNIFVDCNTLE